MTAKAPREGPIKVNLPFDEAIKKALGVKPPAEGWAEYERKLKRRRKPARAKSK